jgi:hypothetical protein
MNPLEGLLQICDQLDALQASSVEGKHNHTAVAAARQKVSCLREDIYSQLPAMRDHAAAASLSDHELLLLALLFRRRLSGNGRMADGGALVGLLCTAGFSRTESLLLLSSGSTLRSKGWLHSQPQPRACDPVDTLFLPSAAALSLFWVSDTPKGQHSGSGAESKLRNPYRDEEEYLWDLYGWRNMCMSRAEALFPTDMPGGAPSPQFHVLRQNAHSALTLIRSRLTVTAEAAEFKLERFRRLHKLGIDHQLVVMHLLFSELIEGEPFISAIECLRVVSETRRDLFRRRSLIGPQGRLRRTGIVLDAASNELGKALATDLTLADWASDDLVSGLNTPPRFDDRDLDEFLKGDDS